MLPLFVDLMLHIQVLVQKFIHGFYSVNLQKNINAIFCGGGNIFFISKCKFCIQQTLG